MSMLAVLAGQLVKGIVGFGSALISVPVLTLIWGPVEGVFLAAMSDLAGQFVLLPGAWRRASVKLVALVLGPLVVVQWLATGLLTTVPVASFKLALSTLLVVLGADMALRPVRKGRGDLEGIPDEQPARRMILTGAPIAGVVSGMLSGLFATPGPPLVVYFRRWFTPPYARAQMLMIFAPGSIVLVASLLARQAVDDPLAMVSVVVWLWPMVIVGGLIGSRLSGRLSIVAAGRVVGSVILLAGILMALTQ